MDKPSTYLFLRHETCNYFRSKFLSVFIRVHPWRIYFQDIIKDIIIEYDYLFQNASLP